MELQFKVNTAGLLKEVAANNETNILEKPLNIFANLLFLVADRAAEINDLQLNALMCKLALYESSDPYHPSYDEELVRATLEAADQLTKEAES